MFQMAVSMLELLRTSTNDYGTRKSILLSLRNFKPDKLWNVYDEMLRRIPDNGKSMAGKVLRILAFAQRALSIPELQHALASDASDLKIANFREYIFNDLEDIAIRKSLASLVKIQESGVQIIHQSIKTYIEDLPSDSQFSCQDKLVGNSFLAQLCIKYLLLWLPDATTSSEGNGPNQSTPELDRSPFLHYAVEYCMDHIRLSSDAVVDILDLVNQLIRADMPNNRN